MSKELLAQALREYPTFADAYLAKRQESLDAKRLLLEVEGMFLSYWTDVPQGEIQSLLPRIRAFLGDFEPASDPTAPEGAPPEH